MSDPKFDDVISRIDGYATDEAFARIVADALALVPQDELAEFKKRLGARCGRVPPSTIDRWARAASVPGENVRRHILNQLRDLLANRP